MAKLGDPSHAPGALEPVVLFLPHLRPHRLVTRALGQPGELRFLCTNICTGWRSESLEREPLDSAPGSAVYCLGLWASGFSSLCPGFPGGKMG